MDLLAIHQKEKGDDDTISNIQIQRLDNPEENHENLDITICPVMARSKNVVQGIRIVRRLHRAIQPDSFWSQSAN